MLTGSTPWAARIDSPVGTLTLWAAAEGLRGIEFGARRGVATAAAPAPPPPTVARVLAAASHQLAEYFARQRRVFSLPLLMEGTDFERSVWQALRAIPYGQTLSYGRLAEAIGRSRSARAVGRASGHNPLPIVIPCHRLVGSRGELTGFGGGLPVKRRLLALEGAVLL